MKKVIDIVLIVVFILFAVVQWNDPDSLLWIVMYILVSLVVVSSFVGKWQKWPTSIFLLLLVGSMLTYLPAIVDWFGDGMPSITTSMKAESMYIELVREFFGLMVSAMAVGGYLWHHQRRS